MRSSKSRSRSKSNRNRSMGNIVNRVFDSSGPEGKVRGTPQQIIDKYNQLARDAQLGNDRVAAENFQQHAEHYTRILGDALREQEAFRAQQQERQQEREDRRDDRGGDQQHGRSRREDESRSDQPSFEPKGERRGDDVIDVSEHRDTGLVETPESTPAKPRRQRRPKKADTDSQQQSEAGSDAAEAAE